MKNPKKLNRRQKEKLSKKNIDPNMYMVLSVNEKDKTFTVVHKTNKDKVMTFSY